MTETVDAPDMESARAALARFVVTARRIEGHSLVKDRETLTGHAQGSWRGRIDLAGKLTLIRDLPEEGVFESLAARVRPLTLGGESVYYE